MSSYSYCYCQCYCTVIVTIIVSVLLILLSVLLYCYSSCQCSRALSLPVFVYCYRQCSRNVTIGCRALLLLLSVLLYCYCSGRVPVTVLLLHCFPLQSSSQDVAPWLSLYLPTRASHPQHMNVQFICSVLLTRTNNKFETTLQQ